MEPVIKRWWRSPNVEAAVCVTAQHRGMLDQVLNLSLGLAFKANIDDRRESPSLEITEQMVKQKLASRLLVGAPCVEAESHVHAGTAGAELLDLDAAMFAADVNLLLVNHQPFNSVDRAALNGKTVIDTRGGWR